MMKKEMKKIMNKQWDKRDKKYLMKKIRHNSSNSFRIKIRNNKANKPNLMK